MNRSVDVLVIGSGAAGLSAARAASRAGARVLVVSRTPPHESHSTQALGGMNGVLSDESDWRHHARDTILASDYLADQDAVQVMCERAAPAIEQLLADGVPMRRSQLGRTGHWPYTLPDITGHSIVQALWSALRRDPAVELWAGARVTQLHLHEGVCTGAHIAAERNSTSAGAGAQRTVGDSASAADVRARAVVLATGGFAHLYTPTVASPEATGDGLSLAYRAGAELMDAEFVQYHPTAIAGTSTLVSERARGAGARLYNALGERFMERHAPAALELAPRDIVSRAIQAELAAGRGCEPGGVRLDFRDVPAARWEQLEFVREIVGQATGLDIRRESVVVAPAVHYTMGGVRTDVHGRTSVPGLWAAGEVACVSVHGANRLGGNSLLEAVVFGCRAGASAAQSCLERPTPASREARLEQATPAHEGHLAQATPICEDHLKQATPAREGHLEQATPAREGHLEQATPVREGARPQEPISISEDALPASRASRAAMAQLRRLMNRHAGVLRERGSLSAGLSKLAALREQEPRAAELELAEVVISCALARSESRGAHFREDHPERDDEHWLLHSIARWDPHGGAPTLSQRPVTLGDWEPTARRG